MAEGRDLAGSTRLLYANTLKHILPALGAVPLPSITPAMVREWHASLKGSTGPTQRAHAYGLLRTILATAVADDVIASNPCRVRGAGQAKRARQSARVPGRAGDDSDRGSRPLQADDPAGRLVRAAVRRADRAAPLRHRRAQRVVHVRRGVGTTLGGRVVNGPKTEAGKRPVAIPPHLMPAVKAHLRDHVGPRGRSGVPGRVRRPHGAVDAVPVFYPAREAAGRPDLSFHDLRHTGATLAAATAPRWPS